MIGTGLAPAIEEPNEPHATARNQQQESSPKHLVSYYRFDNSETSQKSTQIQRLQVLESPS